MSMWEYGMLSLIAGCLAVGYGTGASNAVFLWLGLIFGAVAYILFTKYTQGNKG